MCVSSDNIAVRLVGRAVVMAVNLSNDAAGRSVGVVAGAGV